MRNITNPSSKVEIAHPVRDINRAAGYIRLLSSILREPPALIAIALGADVPVIEEVSLGTAEAA